jgi:hypothetical protein
MQNQNSQIPCSLKRYEGCSFLNLVLSFQKSTSDLGVCNPQSVPVSDTKSIEMLDRAPSKEEEQEGKKGIYCIIFLKFTFHFNHFP